MTSSGLCDAFGVVSRQEESSDDSDSDSDLPSDLADDPFFKEELDARRTEGKQQKKPKKTGKGKKAESEEPDEGDQVSCGPVEEVLVMVGRQRVEEVVTVCVVWSEQGECRAGRSRC